MFWRRSRKSSGDAKPPRANEENEGDQDELVQLQRQFGIKPVSDADVQAEFHKLFGENMSLTSDLASILQSHDDDDDEERKILAELNIKDTRVLESSMSFEEDGHEEHEEHHMHQIVHQVTTSTRVETQQQPSARVHDVAEQVRALKMQAVALKREGKIHEALALFRQAKALEESHGSTEAPSITTVATTTVSVVQTPVTLEKEEEEDHHEDVEVTDEDMNDPEYLAQLSALGLAPPSQQPKETVESLQQEIHRLKKQAVQLKRENQIKEALDALRQAKQLEAKLQELQHDENPTEIKVVQDSSQHNPPEARVVTTEALCTTEFGERAIDEVSEQDDQEACAVVANEDVFDEDDPVEVTDRDLDDSLYDQELEKLGVQTNTKGDAKEENEAEYKASPPAAFGRIYSVDEDDLIDEFDDEGVASPIPVQKASAIPMIPEETPHDTTESVDAQGPSSSRSEVSDLTTQLEQTKKKALELKRDGKIQEALDMLRRMKQIEHLIQLKQQQPPPQSPPPAVEIMDPVAAAKFQELEQLLVQYGNQAMQNAKDYLARDRTKAAEWLQKRKMYAAELDKLRERRQNPRQWPPNFRIERHSEEIEFQLTSIPEDELHVSIHSINSLPQAASKEVYVKFCLSFPSNAPHEAKTQTFTIVAASTTLKPHVYKFKIQRSRGTQRIFEIKKAVFEVWKPGSLLRNPEMIARGYQALSPLLSVCEIHCHVPFVGSNRKPTGGDIEIQLSLRTPLRDPERRVEHTETLVIEEYPDPNESNEAPPTTIAIPSISQPISEESEPSDHVTQEQDDLEDPCHVDLIESYDVMNQEIEKIESKLTSVSQDAAVELRDRLDSLGLKKQLLEIEMQTGKLTLPMYVDRLQRRIHADRVLMKRLLHQQRRMDAARVLHRIKIMEKELEGASDN